MPTCRALRALLIACALALFPGAGSAQGLFEDPRTFSFAGVSFPAVVDTFAVMSAERWPDPTAGVHLQYRTPLDPTASIDLYVYAADDRGTEGEFTDAVRSILVYAEQNREGVTATIDTTHALTVTDAAGLAHRGWVAAARFERGGDVRPSILYLFEKDGRYFKYRVTHAAPLRLRLAPHLEAFLAGTLAEVTTARP